MARMARLYLRAATRISGANMKLPANSGEHAALCRQAFSSQAIGSSARGFSAIGVVLVDRHRARIFDLRLGELTEREDLFHPLSRRGRSDGFAGYDGGHAQRRVEDETRQHFKNVAESLKELLEQGVFREMDSRLPGRAPLHVRTATTSLRESGTDWPFPCRLGTRHP